MFFQLREVVKPLPREDEVLIRFMQPLLNSRDLRMHGQIRFYATMPGGLFHPKNKILGAECCWTSRGNWLYVKLLNQVIRSLGFCRVRSGAARLQSSMCQGNFNNTETSQPTFEQSAAVPLASMTALQDYAIVENIRPGQKVLINGASGGVGTFAVQIAKTFGAKSPRCAVRGTRNGTLDWS